APPLPSLAEQTETLAGKRAEDEAAAEMDAYATHLAMAALVGASIVAISAYFMHRKTLTQVLDFARAERERGGRGRRPRGEDDDDINEVDDDDVPLPNHYKRRGHQNHLPARRKTAAVGSNRRWSASLPDVTAMGSVRGEDGDHEVEERRPAMNGPFSASGSAAQAVEDQRSLGIPPGLPRLHTFPEGNRQPVSANSTKRSGHPVMATSPKSPAPCASAFESLEGSDDEDSLTNVSKLDSTFLHANGNAGPECDNLFQALPDHVDSNGNPKPLPAANMIRSHSVSGDLHGVQPDPVAADILRKEPEQESFIRLKITPTETPTSDEAEVYMLLQECLKLRESYLFREEVAPWEKEIITDPSTPKPNPNPFAYVAEGKTDHHFQMEDGVVHVYANKDSTEQLFPVADATTFFTDLHRILRVIAAGNTRTVCHRRLVLLEQKFNMHLMLNADAEFLAQKSAPHRDFYNVRKVDTHVHHSACMNQKHLLRFIKSKLRKEPDEVVIFRDGTYLTLKEVFESLDLTGYDLNVDLLDVHADKSTFHRFDKFNLKYNPCGQSRLREIFLKQDNLIQGKYMLRLVCRFLAELTKQVFSDLAASKYQSEWFHKPQMAMQCAYLSRTSQNYGCCLLKRYVNHPEGIIMGN
ncbi:hypothetical protein Taro_013518, partial [Colocasia esculenta]|nr:hypothetical protein [Colocasia esculenta]